MAEKREKLFDQFPPVSTAEWRAKVEADLKGAPFDKKLVWRTNEGFNVQPMYRLEDIEGLATTNSLPGEFPYVRGTRTDNDWLVRQEIEAETPADANRIALDVLGKGVNSLGFRVADVADLDTLLAGIDLAKVEVNFTCCLKKALPLPRLSWRMSRSMDAHPLSRVRLISIRSRSRSARVWKCLPEMSQIWLWLFLMQ